MFVNAPLEQVAEYAQILKLSAVQLHGNEDELYIDTLRKQLPVTCQIWKAQGVDTALPSPFAGVDKQLYDTKTDTAFGGTGQVFDWQLLNRSSSNYMLAGGLNPDNIHGAVNIGADGLDLNSGVEQSPGKKCAQKIANAFTQIRKY